MKIHNLLSPFVDCIQRWDQKPALADFTAEYYSRVQNQIEGALFIRDVRSLYGALKHLDWAEYRRESLTLDPVREEARLSKHIASVEQLFGFPLEGEAILFSSFSTMDGFARFDRGTHRVYLGVDESHARDPYLDILMTHELTHVARESRPEVWQGWGLNPKMTSVEFGEYQPVIEHVFGEGFSCAVSELLVPGQDPWLYCYQKREGLELAYRNARAIGERIRQEIALTHADSDYTRLYDPSQYAADVPYYAQYVWGWQWAKQLLAERAGGDPRKLVTVCSREFLESLRQFELA